MQHRDPRYTITGIACVPLEIGIPSPEAEVIEGGLNYDHVTLLLTPLEEGEWGCDIAICGVEVTIRQVVGLPNVCFYSLRLLVERR